MAQNILILEDRPLAQKIAHAFAKVGLVMKASDWEVAGRVGLNPAQGQVLSLLLSRHPQPMRLADIASELAVSCASASDSVAALESKGYVSKKRSRRDGRALAIGLTAKGRACARKADGHPNVVADSIEKISTDEQVAVLRVLLHMIREMQLRRSIPVSRMCVTCRYFRPNVHRDPEQPHHCALVDSPFGDANLRVDCPDHEREETSVATE